MFSNSVTIILSTGRTGTKFFEKYINETFSEAYCTHEPKPTRIFKLYSDLYLKGILKETIIARHFVKSRKKIISKLPGDKAYIESNPFLYGCIPAINTRMDNLKIIHIVRNPLSYIESHINNGFWRGYKKFFYKYVPYWSEFDEEGPISRLNDTVLILAKRWKIINTIIQEYEHTNEYLLIRFEDLLKGSEEQSVNMLNQVREYFGDAPISLEENLEYLRKPVNKSTHNYFDNIEMNESRKKFIHETCGELMNKYGYE